ncbi:mannose-6-phosphate isomerase [Methanoculleus taiwanensis]|uniref:Mannose-6-phosphate isomerase n=2 Tax=Methanoculleus taiwanensis TaxID=1550565 RepID=A0A498H3Q2_9EURY|nr:mannose-6-phosphate isomerase [Methanoculleus taiwanensis]
MLIRDIRDAPHARVMDNSLLCELLHPDRETAELAMGYSIAHAVVPAGEATLPHRLSAASEVYCILEGEGVMHIDTKSAPVRPGQAVYIPPGAVQWIESTSSSDLVFLCIVDPRWREEDEELVSIPCDRLTQAAPGAGETP